MPRVGGARRTALYKRPVARRSRGRPTLRDEGADRARRPRRGPPGRRSATALRSVAEGLGVAPEDAFQPVSVAIEGSTIPPGICEPVSALGRDETPRRIDAELARG